MLNLNATEKIQARPPPSIELIAGFRKFIEYKRQTNEAINNHQARHMLRTFKHLQQSNISEEGFGLNLEDLRLASIVITKMPHDNISTHNELARQLYSEIHKRTARNSISKDRSTDIDLRHFVKVLTLTGDSTEARGYAEQFWASIPPSGAAKMEAKSGRKLWYLVLQGFAKENNEDELVKTAELAEAAGVPYSFISHEIMTTFYAGRNDVAATKRWYGKKTAGDRALHPTAHTMSTLLRFCLRNDELDWCKIVFRKLLESNPTKDIWDVVFQWAAGGLGKGVEEVEYMMEVMVRRNPDDNTIRPDTETINGLVDLAISLNDPYLAERYIVLGLKSGIRPNARTFILQMDYRIDAGDLTGAHAAYEALQAEEIVDNEDLAVINKYIRTLCSSKTSTFDRVDSIVSDLEDRHVHLEGDTVSALCMLYLKREKINEVIDTLQGHTLFHTLDERARIRDAFVDFCLDRNNSNARAWDAYQIFRQVYDETDINIRTQIMNEFFSRGRPDMACHVFGHMRQHPVKDRRPVVETYVKCFEGIARCGDIESLEMVYNMMKMDSSIEPNTRLYNALMLAFTACEDPEKAMDFWDDITNSTEGPSYSSLEIVFRVCEKKPFGEKPAKEIWSKMMRMEIEVTREVFTAYCGALAGKAKFDEVKALIEGMEKDFGFGPDLLT